MAEDRQPVALVTGGSRGIGRAITERLARDGHAVAINYAVDSTAAEELTAKLRAEGLDAEPVQGDVCEPDQVTRIFTHIADRFGAHPSVVVNNVGEFALGTTADMSPGRWKRIIDSNLNSAFYVTREALPEMRRNRYGRVIFIGMAPTLQVRGAPNIAAYAVAKTGVSILTRSLATEEAGHGITVNCVAPGLMDNGYLSPSEAQWMLSRVPSGRLGRPEEVANAIGFLISDQAQYVNGATLSVSGGWEWDNRPVEHDTVVEHVFRTDGADRANGQDRPDRADGGTDV
jgi:3-oxoacyl-[acyl-carrier protein] reductase